MRELLNQKDRFIKYLTSRLTGKLPASDAHLQMIPVFDAKPHRTLVPQPGARNAAVLLLLVPGKEDREMHLLFTLRSSSLNGHTSQISFPGGRIETGENEMEAALRETNEEIGIERKYINIIGKLSPLYVQPTKWVISPVIGYIEDLPDLNINPAEVEEVFFVPLYKFFLPGTKQMDSNIFKDSGVMVPYWDVHPTVPLWGATAMILMEFLMLAEEYINSEKSGYTPVID